MKRISTIALTLFVLTSSCFSADRLSQADYPLGVFNFDIARLGADEAGQVRELKSIGYGGLVMNLTNPKQLGDHHHTSFKRFQEMLDAK